MFFRIFILTISMVVAAFPALASTNLLLIAADHDSGDDRISDLYERGTEALDEHEWRKAAEAFRSVAAARGDRADAALYWLAYAQSKQALVTEALNTLGELQKAFPKSKWISDAKQLEVEIRQAVGRPVSPESSGDDEVKLMALSGLMNSDPQRALPILERIIAQPKEPKVRDRALFVLSQAGSPEAIRILTRVATNETDPDMQVRAIKYISIMGGEQGRRLLNEVYGKSKDAKVKKSVIKGFMISGDKTHLLNIVRTESDEDLRGDAVTNLGLVGAKNELAELYITEKSIPIRKKVLHAMFLGGSAQRIGEIARTEKVPELRMTAIKNLGLMGGKETSSVLLAIYGEDLNVDVRKAVVNSLFIQGNAKALIDLARKEKDPTLRKALVSKISLVGGKDAAEYLLELLQE